MAERVKKEKPKYCEIIGGLMTLHKESQQALADALGVTRNVVENWLGNRSKLDIENLTKIARHYDVPTDFVLGLTTVRLKNPSLRLVEEYTGLSEGAIISIACATGKVFRNLEKVSKSDLPKYLDVDHTMPVASSGAVEVLDDLLCHGGGEFLTALIDIKRLTEEIADDPPHSSQRAKQLYNSLCLAMFTLSEELRTSADEIYHFSDSLQSIRHLIYELEEAEQQED